MIKVGTPKEGQRNYCIGIDVGERGIGLAAIEVDARNYPVQILAILSHRIDGGASRGNGPTRMSEAGRARRTRRLYRRRHARLKRLDHTLKELGYSIHEESQTYEVWHARHRLVTELVTDTEERNLLVSLAVRHIARHRGQRNPWLEISNLRNMYPSHSLTQIQYRAEDRFNLERGSLADETIGQIGKRGSQRNVLLRPRNPEDKKKGLSNKRGLSAIEKTPLLQNVRQEDHLMELERIWEKQQLPKAHLEALIDEVFARVHPRQSSAQMGVGRDPLVGRGPLRDVPKSANFHALQSSLEFQEFRILEATANMSVIDSIQSQNRRRLTFEEFERLSSELLTWHLHHDLDEHPTWDDAASILGVKRNSLVLAVADFVGPDLPWNRTLAHLRYAVRHRGTAMDTEKRAQVIDWFNHASSTELSHLIQALTNAFDDENMAEITGASDSLAVLGADAADVLEQAIGDADKGRARYSLPTLRLLTEHMQRTGLNSGEARQELFPQLSPGWEPPLPHFDELTGHPTTDQNLSATRKFVLGCVSKWGAPRHINIEVARKGVMTPEKLKEYEEEVTSNRDRQAPFIQFLRDEGIPVNKRNIRRRMLVQRQNSRCLYCPNQINMQYCQLDHIVSRKGGGNSTGPNLVAVCIDCNQEKQAQVFSVWAKSHHRASLDLAIENVQNWGPFPGRPPESPKTLERLKRRVIQRLKQTEEDAPIDERRMQTTAYAATALRDRIVRSYEEQGFTRQKARLKVGLYRGGLVNQARIASGTDRKIGLRGQDRKFRGDFRHHAIDAAVVALLTNQVGITLSRREARYQEWKLLQGQSRIERSYYSQFTGHSLAEQKTFNVWTEKMNDLSTLLVERISNDAVPVKNPLRLGRKVGALHGKLQGLTLKAADSPWSDEEISRIIDNDLYLRFRNELGFSTKSTEPTTSQLTQIFKEEPIEDIKLFKASSHRLTIREAAAATEVHHLRLYGWTKNGGLAFGALRVFSGEIHRLWPDKHTDILTATLPTWSASVRDKSAPGELRKMIHHNDSALKPLGWIAPGDEIELDLSQISSKWPKGIKTFLEAFPNENRWRFDGIYDSPLRIILKPLYISQDFMQVANPPEVLSKVFGGKWMVSLTNLLPHITVIRRNALGEARHYSRHLPSSFSPMEEARRLLG